MHSPLLCSSIVFTDTQFTTHQKDTSLGGQVTSLFALEVEETIENYGFCLETSQSPKSRSPDLEKIAIDIHP